MNRPTWVMVIGILMIIFGVFGIFGSGQLMFMPKFMEFQKNLIAPALEEAKHKDPQAEKILEEFEKIMNMSDSTKQTIVIMGIFSLFITGFYLLAGIFMLQMKKNFVKIAYWAIGLSMTFTLFQTFLAMSSDSVFFMFMMIGGIFSITIDVVLLIVIILNDKPEIEYNQPVQAV